MPRRWQQRERPAAASEFVEAAELPAASRRQRIRPVWWRRRVGLRRQQRKHREFVEVAELSAASRWQCVRPVRRGVTCFPLRALERSRFFLGRPGEVFYFLVFRKVRRGSVIGLLSFACFPLDVGSHGTCRFLSRTWDRTGQHEGEAKFYRTKMVSYL
jgi:hypothetical protein